MEDRSIKRSEERMELVYRTKEGKKRREEFERMQDKSTDGIELIKKEIIAINNRRKLDKKSGN